MQEQAKHILLVEDDDTNRKLVRIVLGGGRYRISEAVSVEQALALLQHEKPDLLLLDIRLGDGSGLDVIRHVRANPAFDQIPALAITAQAMKDDESRFLAAGFDGYLSKPIDTRRLPEVVERFLREGRKAGHA
ncbi:MAG: response regulator [Gammaproteobacteria bacterium]|jgi:CheY-like chemotaxis protein|nr:response regulator [Gammaproteobacteria bacterium]MBU1408894.1 response regulator [Gammaproteobacteria bacterium]MBU1532731.1 response regulator [Gammaproteobacteria bacterium]